MTAGASAMAPLPLVRVAGYLLAIAGLAFCIALLWLGMRAVMAVPPTAKRRER